MSAAVATCVTTEPTDEEPPYTISVLPTGEALFKEGLPSGTTVYNA
jgi:hypothetical protein